jgi:hypothetical protein
LNFENAGEILEKDTKIGKYEILAERLDFEKIEKILKS